MEQATPWHYHATGHWCGREWTRPACCQPGSCGDADTDRGQARPVQGTISERRSGIVQIYRPLTQTACLTFHLLQRHSLLVLFSRVSDIPLPEEL
ncbi:hypothetical protein MHYP_G00017870 [Metynnis hypsauchen]